ncbi:hypothetical protein HUU59_02945 [bacterium]|nr:hypothetical protein [bacterium]
MGLHLHTEQRNDQALIAVYGEITARSARQLEAAVEHFRTRGCSVVNVEIRSDGLDRSLNKWNSPSVRPSEP